MGNLCCCDETGGSKTERLVDDNKSTNPTYQSASPKQETSSYVSPAIQTPSSIPLHQTNHQEEIEKQQTVSTDNNIHVTPTDIHIQEKQTTSEIPTSLDDDLTAPIPEQDNTLLASFVPDTSPMLSTSTITSDTNTPEDSSLQPTNAHEVDEPHIEQHVSESDVSAPVSEPVSPTQEQEQEEDVIPRRETAHTIGSTEEFNDIPTRNFSYTDALDMILTRAAEEKSSDKWIEAAEQSANIMNNRVASTYNQTLADEADTIAEELQIWLDEQGVRAEAMAQISDEAIARGEGGEFQISIHLEQENTELRSKLPSEYKGLKVRVILMQGMQPDPDVMGTYAEEF